MQLDWYVALALWKAVAFMEGNYKRAIAGSTDDPYLKSFGDGVIELAGRALDVTRNGSEPTQGDRRDGARYRGLLVDWGGVMTSNMFGTFRAFCEREGLSPTRYAHFRGDPASRELLIELETGALPEEQFELLIR